MRLIAFDLEACNRYVPGSIFSIGIVEADDSFKVYKKYNIFINPETKFVTKFRKPIEFNVDEKTLKEELNFPKIYNQIRDLFSQDAIYLAHSVSNDIRMLNYACKRYGLPSLKFNFICSQMIYSVFSNTEDGIGLNNAGEIINVPFMHHQSDEDALISLKLVEFICTKKNMTLNELINDYGITFGSLNNFEIKLMHSSVLDYQRQERKILRQQEKLNNNSDNIG